MHTYQISHPALSHPIEIEASFPRAENIIKMTAARHLDIHFGNLGWDWLTEMGSMTVVEMATA